jgi:resolvase-like protein
MVRKEIAPELQNGMEQRGSGLPALSSGARTIVNQQASIASDIGNWSVKTPLSKSVSGDPLVVWKLDRLGRSLRDLITMLDDLKSASAWLSARRSATSSGSSCAKARGPMVAGLLVGVFLAVGSSYLLGGVLYGLNAVDGISCIGVSLLFLVARLASLPTSQDAMRAGPMVALKYE